MKLDGNALKEDIINKLRSFRKEYDTTHDTLRKEMIYGEIKMLRYYLEAIESGRFDFEFEGSGPTAQAQADKGVKSHDQT